MLTFASWYEPSNWRGELMRISRYAGRGLKKSIHNWGVVPCLLPDWGLVKAYRSQMISWDEYSTEYLRGLELRWDEVQAWLISLKPEDDVTLLCHEREGERCHRQLVVEHVMKYQPNISTRLH